MLPVDTRSRGQTDADIRALLIPRLLQDAVRSNSLLIEELGLMSGEFRADIAVLGTKLIGYEIKSETDTLSRLPRQAAAYGAIFDEVWAEYGPDIDIVMPIFQERRKGKKAPAATAAALLGMAAR